MAQIAPQAGYTCSGCDTRWSGVSRCHCSGCHRTFSGEVLFDRHRRDDRSGNGSCVAPDTITNPSGRAKGERVMWQTNGIWYGVESPADPTLNLTAWRERVSTEGK